MAKTAKKSNNGLLRTVEKLKFNHLLRILGPGLITGAADDDPSGIATYSQTGAQFGYGQLWTALFTFPLLISIQEACARIGAVTGKGIAGIVKDNYGRKVLYGVVGLVIIANIINIGADLGAMAEATRLVVNIPFATATFIFVFIILFLEIFTSYKLYVKLLKWLAVTLLAYPVTAFIVKQPWGEVFHALLIPHLELSFGFLFVITGVIGTTISPYMFFWQASEEVEDEIAAHRLAQRGGIPRISRHFIRNLRIDTVAGMLASQTVTFFIIITAAATLHAHGVTDIKTAADAAKALEPLVKTFPNAGQIAKDLFAIGVIGLGLLAVPVLAGSASYALSEAMGWNEGLYRKFKRARGFYAVIMAATLAGLGINFVGIDPIKALVFTAVFNGVAAVPLIYIIARISARKDIMGQYRSGPLSRLLVWTTFTVMTLSALGLFYTLASSVKK